jgi:nitroimidazol reductase NimA-like FMN-containing flavoprotein (pyridoxamine 5'-phosphate oxidase superfamily)
MSADPRSRAQRRRDSEHRLTHDFVDVWVVSVSADGAPYLVPLSFDWEDEALLVATPTDSPTGSPTGRNLAAARTARLGLCHTRNVSMIAGKEQMETR